MVKTMPSLTINQRMNYARIEFGSGLCLEQQSIPSPQSIRDWLIVARSPTHQHMVCQECRQSVETMFTGRRISWSNLDLRTWSSNLLVRRIRRHFYNTNPRFESYEDPLGW